MNQWQLVWIVFFITALFQTTESLQECGRSLTSGQRRPRNGSFSQGRIINGKPSMKGAWPWQVSLQLLHPKFGLIGHWCGGVLIQPLWILTAAHCITNELFSLPLAALWTAVLGEWDRDVEENTEVHIPIDLIIIHERFHNYQNDIAMMKLSRAVEFPPVCLPTEMTAFNLYPELSNTLEQDPLQNEENLVARNPFNRRRPRKLKKIPTNFFQLFKSALNFANRPSKKATQCIATGWGRQTALGKDTAHLLEAKMPLLDNSVCENKYGGSINIRMGHLCAGRLDGTTGTCVGDSGGPLQCSLQDGRWVLAGITSFGSGCAKPGYPDVYTRLAFYIPWINKQLAKHSEEEEIMEEDTATENGSDNTV